MCDIIRYAHFARRKINSHVTEGIPCHCMGTASKLRKSGKSDVTFLRGGWAELYKT